MNNKKKILFSKSRNDLQTNIVAAYNFNGNLIDEVNGNNATNFGGTFVAGKIGQAIKYTTTGQYSVIPHTSNLNFTDGTNDLDFSIFLRLKLNITNPALTQGMILSKGLNVEYRVNMQGGSIDIYLFTNGSNYKRYRFNSFAVLGVYKDYIFTHSNGTIKLFIDGVEYSPISVNTIGTYTRMPLLTNTLQISKLGTSGSYYAAIDLDAFAIWKGRVLTETEALYIYNNNIGREYPF